MATVKYRKAQPSEQQAPQQQYAPWERPPLPLTDGLGIYARQSSAGQVKNNLESNEMQTEGLIQYGIELGWTDELITLFDQDMARSGKIKIVDREGMLTLTDMIRQGLIKAVLAAKEDRLFRDETALEYNTFIQVCKQYNCLVIIPPFTIYNFANKRDVKEFRYQCEKAADFLDDYVGRLHDLKQRAISKGNYGGGFIPIGSTVDRRRTIEENGVIRPNPYWKKFVRYEPHAEVVDWCLELYYEIRSLNGVVREAERLGKRFPDFPAEIDPRNRRIASKRIDDEKGGYLVTIALLEYVFSNAFYAGHLIRNGQIIRENDHDPIVKNLDHFWYAFNQVSRVTIDGEKRERKQAPRRNFQKEGDEAALLKYVVSSNREKQTFVKYHGKAKNVKWAYNVVRVRPNGVRVYEGEVSVQVVDDAFIEQFRKKIAEIKSHTDYSAEIQRERAAQEARHAVQKTRLEIIKLERENILEEIKTVPPLNLPEEVRKKLILTPEARQKLRMDDWTLAAEQQAIEAELAQPTRTQSESKALRYKHLVLEHADHWENYSMSEKHKFLEQVIEEVTISFPTPHWIEVTITWINPEWGTDTGYIWDKGRKGANPNYSDEEIEKVKALYPAGTQREVLEALPMRTWQSIIRMAYLLKLSRKHQWRNESIPPFWSIEDITFAEEKGIDTAKMMLAKFAYWLVCPRRVRSLWD